MRRKRDVAYLLTAIFVVCANLVGAQEGPVTFEFSFSNPGARSMGLGGAFAALADDATAAFANPAGLVQLIEPEISLEGRRWSYDTPYVSGGRALGEPTGIGIDTESTLTFGNSAFDVTGISFVSFVLPADRWSFAVYRHTWADYRLNSQIDGLFLIEDEEDARSEDVVSWINFDVTNTGAAASYEVSESLSLGIGVVYYETELNGVSEEYAVEDEGFFAPNPQLPELLDTTYDYRGKDDGFAVHVGLLWRPSPQWSVGAYYREGPQMSLSFTETKGPADDDPETDPVTIMSGVVDLPEVYGLGVAYRTLENALTISAEWARVGYSSIGRTFDGFIFDEGQLRLSDGDEYHLGLEYVFVGVEPIIALRAGAWHDPAHGFAPGTEADPDERAIYTGGDDQMHYTIGIGLVFAKGQIDLGVDLSDTVDTVSLSMVYRF